MYHSSKSVGDQLKGRIDIIARFPDIRLTSSYKNYNCFATAEQLVNQVGSSRTLNVFIVDERLSTFIGDS